MKNKLSSKNIFNYFSNPKFKAIHAHYPLIIIILMSFSQINFVLASPQFCSRLFSDKIMETNQLNLNEFNLKQNNEAQNQKKTIKKEYRIELNGLSHLKILRVFNRIFIEYPREYIELSPDWAQIVIPKSRWDELFKTDFSEIVTQLKNVTIQRTDYLENGEVAQVTQTNLLLGYDSRQIRTFKNEWVPTQETFIFRIDRKIINLMEQVQEPAHVAFILESGLFHSLYLKNGKWTQWNDQY